MSASGLDTFGQKVTDNGVLRENWEKLKLILDRGQVASRKEGYLTFSRALKISNNLPQDEKLKKLWEGVLHQGKISIQNTDLKYDFKSLLALFQKGKAAFDVSWKVIDPSQDDLEGVAEIVHSIAVEALGPSPGVAFFKSKLENPITLCMVAKYNDIPIACTYGTYVKDLKLVHFNFLGRKIDYPGAHIIENLQTQVGVLVKRFPDLDCITLKVEELNTHARSIYQSIGFETIDYIKDGFEGKPTFFCGLKLKDVELPSYQTFKPLYEAARKG